MCGRYRIKDAETFRLYVKHFYGIDLPDMKPRYNIAPSQLLPIVATDENGTPRAASMKWGLVPFWEKSAKPKIAPINARGEDAFTKPMFKQSIQRRRCLVPADGFYEWQKLAGDLKQPMDIRLKGEKPFFFAGIYEDATELHPECYLLFTTRPNELMEPIHNRMPAILTDEKAKRWLHPGPMTLEQMSEMTAPFPATEMEARPISTLINNPRNDVPECIAGPDDPRHTDERI
jgi:putative SOS response-associated peptidase YedK